MEDDVDGLFLPLLFAKISCMKRLEVSEMTWLLVRDDVDTG